MLKLNKIQRRMNLQEQAGTLSGPGAVDPLKKTTYFTSTGAGNALTLANGTYYGQRTTILKLNPSTSGTGVITQTTGAALAGTLGSITLTNTYESVTLEWDGSAWYPVTACPVAVAVAS
jgi:hypothetical protein